MKNFNCVSDAYDNDASNIYTLESFLEMCQDCFGQQPELNRDYDKNGVEFYRDQTRQRVLQAVNE